MLTTMNPWGSRYVGGAGVDRAEDAALGEPFWTPGALAADLELRLGLSPVSGSGLEREDAYAARL